MAVGTFSFLQVASLAGALYVPAYRGNLSHGDLSEKPQKLRLDLPAALKLTTCLRYSGNGGWSDGCSAWTGSEPEEFPDCALVSSADNLRGRALGADIDAHSIVIRINRLPTEAFREDFGNRTDILWANHWEADTGHVTLLGPPKADCKHELSHPKCFASRDCHGGGEGCPTMAVVSERQSIHKRWRHAPVPTFTMIPKVMKAVMSLKYCYARPSAGFWAFVTFLPTCRKMTLYGFSGTGTADGHVMFSKHSFDAEHGLYRQLARHQRLNPDDWDTTASGEDYEARRWLMSMLNFRPITVVPEYEDLW